MIGVCVDLGKFDELWVLFERMRNEGIVFDRVVVVIIVNVCVKFGVLYKVVIFYDYICLMNFFVGVVFGIVLIDMYVKCGNFDVVREMFDLMKDRNVILWSVMIVVYGYYGKVIKVFEFFDVMVGDGRLFFNEIIFVFLFNVCSYVGFVKEGFEIFDLMIKYGVRLNVKYYICMIDFLG